MRAIEKATETRRVGNASKRMQGDVPRKASYTVGCQVISSRLEADGPVAVPVLRAYRSRGARAGSLPTFASTNGMIIVS